MSDSIVWVVIIKYMEVEELSGVLLADIMDVFRPSVILKVAFILGSSKQGKARRASDASN